MRKTKFKFYLGHTGEMTHTHTLDEISKVIPKFTPDIVELQFTGFYDTTGKEIYDFDSLTDSVETDDGPIKSNRKVFWNQRTGSWYLDDSFKQDQTGGTELWMELRDFDYEVITCKKNDF